MELHFQPRQVPPSTSDQNFPGMSREGGLVELGVQGHQAVHLVGGPEWCLLPLSSSQALRGVTWPMSSQCGQQEEILWFCELPNSSPELYGPPAQDLTSAVFQSFPGSCVHLGFVCIVHSRM